jgi:8-oxo-dGTP diphosphatase
MGAVVISAGDRAGKPDGPPVADEGQSPARVRFGSSHAPRTQPTDLVKNPSTFGPGMAVEQRLFEVMECLCVEGSGMTGRRREGASAVLVSTEGRLLLQLRDNLPHVSDPGKIGLFGGHREGDESFLECVVREIHEEIGYYLPPERFELIVRYSGPDHSTLNGTRHDEVFLARNVPVDNVVITEGRLKIVAMDELYHIRDLLAASASYALGIFLNGEQAI